MARLYKHYVGVISYTNMEGESNPIYVVWNEGIKYRIKKIYRITNSNSETGGCSVLYDCQIEGKRVRLFKEKTRWFMECNLPPIDFWAGC